MLQFARRSPAGAVRKPAEQPAAQPARLETKLEAFRRSGGDKPAPTGGEVVSPDKVPQEAGPMRALALLAAASALAEGGGREPPPVPGTLRSPIPATRRARPPSYRGRDRRTIEAVNAAGDVFRLKIEPDMTLYADATIT